mgnify:CR=1 FL=1
MDIGFIILLGFYLSSKGDKSAPVNEWNITEINVVLQAFTKNPLYCAN